MNSDMQDSLEHIESMLETSNFKPQEKTKLKTPQP